MAYSKLPWSEQWNADQETYKPHLPRCHNPTQLNLPESGHSFDPLPDYVFDLQFLRPTGAFAPVIEPELAHSSTTTRGYFKVEPGADHPPAQVLLEVPRDPLVHCHCPLNCTQPEIMAPVVDVISGILHLLQENLQFEKVTG